MAKGRAVMKKMILQLMRKIQSKAMMIWPKAQPIDSTIGEEVLRTFSVTSEIDKNDAL